ncbi:MAG: cell division protein FtsQ/DivIB [Pseudomonadota bacterium]
MRPLAFLHRRARPDPAPSRLSYRLHRLWLTPRFRLGVRVILPCVLTCLAGLHYLSQPQVAEAVLAYAADVRRQIEERPEFMVKLMAIDGGTEELSQDLREVLPIDFPVSSFDLDLEEIRQAVEQLDVVESAQVRIRPGGVLQVDVTERTPAVVWRGPQGLELLDATGRRVAPLVSRGTEPDLPLILGTGADAAVPEALELMAISGPIAGRVRGIVRIGERRWDLVLDRDQRILLPEQAPVPALERVIALDQAPRLDLLSRRISVVDMRLAERPTVRLAPDNSYFLGDTDPQNGTLPNE